MSKIFQNPLYKTLIIILIEKKKNVYAIDWWQMIHYLRRDAGAADDRRGARRRGRARGRAARAPRWAAPCPRPARRAPPTGSRSRASRLQHAST